MGVEEKFEDVSCYHVFREYISIATQLSKEALLLQVGLLFEKSSKEGPNYEVLKRSLFQCMGSIYGCCFLFYSLYALKGSQWMFVGSFVPFWMVSLKKPWKAVIFSDRVYDSRVVGQS